MCAQTTISQLDQSSGCQTLGALTPVHRQHVPEMNAWPLRLLTKSSCPIERDSKGVMKGANESLHVATVDMSTLSVSIPTGAKLTEAVSALEVCVLNLHR